MRYVVIGNSAAGVSAAWTLRQRDPKAQIEIISDERHACYSRILLMYLVAGRVDDVGLWLQRVEDYERVRVDLRLDERVEGIDAAAHRLHTTRRAAVPYDRLLLATGASAIRPQIPGIELAGIETLRILEDAQRIMDGATPGESVVVVGGGLIGVRAAEALAARKLRAHLIVSSPQILSQMLDAGSAAVMLNWLRGHGIDIRLSTDVKEFGGLDALRAVTLSDGSRIPARLAVVGKGVRANTSLVADSPIRVESGIRVDDRLETDARDVYAAGDVAEAYDPLRRRPWINALWPIAVEQGRLAAANMSGGAERYGGSIRMNALAVFGYPCVSVGHVYDLPDADTLVYHERSARGVSPAKTAWPGTYRKLFFQDGRLVGAVLMGDVTGAGIVTEAIRVGRPVSRAWAEATLARGSLFSRQMAAVWEAA